MDFLIELILDIFGEGIEGALNSSKVPLKAKLILLSVVCGLLFAVCAFFGVWFVIKTNVAVSVIFILLALLFVGFWIFGTVRLIKRNTK